VTKLATRSKDNKNLEWTAATTVLMATWWITEAIPLPATALLPLVVSLESIGYVLEILLHSFEDGIDNSFHIFPIAGVMTSSETAGFYVQH
jgi:di/tricarboxylate transporter